MKHRIRHIDVNQSIFGLVRSIRRRGYMDSERSMQLPWESGAGEVRSRRQRQAADQTRLHGLTIGDVSVVSEAKRTRVLTRHGRSKSTLRCNSRGNVTPPR